MEDLDAGTIIEEYCGEIITEKECRKRMTKLKEDDAFYFAALDGNLVIDAAIFGTTARFANHNCNPNCTLQKWIVNGEPRIVLRAITDIKDGEELTYNYNYFHDGLNDIIGSQRQKCNCQYKYCSGTIGGKVNLPELAPQTKWLEKVKLILHHIVGPNSGIVYKEKRISDLINSAQGMDKDSDIRLCQTKEYLQLHELYAQYSAWKLEFEELMSQASSKFHIDMISFDTFSCVVSRAPRGICCDEVSSTIQKVQKLFSKVEIISVSNGERLDWKQFVILIETSVKLLPIESPSCRNLLIWYEQYSDWCYHTYYHIFFRTPHNPKQLKFISLWSELALLSKIYDVEITPWALLTEFFLEGILQKYHRREDNFTKRERLGEKFSTQLHCFCQMEEDYSEYSKMIECDLCNRWYHPQCVRVSDRLLEKENIDFICPLCEWDGYYPNSFLCGDLIEWHNCCVTSIRSSLKVECENADHVAQIKTGQDRECHLCEESFHLAMDQESKLLLEQVSISFCWLVIFHRRL